MKFRCMTLGPAVALLLVSGTLLGAQEIEQSVKVSYINPQGDMRVLTQSPSGYGLEYNLDFLASKESGIGVGLNAGWFSSKGKKGLTGNYLQPDGSPTDGGEGSPIDSMFVSGTCTVKGGYAGADILYRVGETPLTIRTGPFFIAWDITQVNPLVGIGAMGETSWKIGWRVGGEYRINKEWTASLFYSQAHWQNLATDAIAGNNFQSNPSWLSIMAGYKF